MRSLHSLTGVFFAASGLLTTVAMGEEKPREDDSHVRGQGTPGFPFGIQIDDKSTWPCEPESAGGSGWFCVTLEREYWIRSFEFETSSLEVQFNSEVAVDSESYRPYLIRLSHDRIKDCGAVRSSLKAAMAALDKKYVRSSEFAGDRPKRTVHKPVRRLKCKGLSPPLETIYSLVWKGRWVMNLTVDAYPRGMLGYQVFVSYVHLPGYEQMLRAADARRKAGQRKKADAAKKAIRDL